MAEGAAMARSFSPDTRAQKPTPQMSALTKPQPLVTFLVGTGVEQQKFDVHKEFAVFYSPVFDAAFNGSFKESETQTMILDDINGEEFGWAVHWLYFKTLKTPAKNNGLSWGREKLMLLGKIWILGERFMIPGLQNAAMSLIVILMEGEDFEHQNGRSLLKDFAALAYQATSEEGFRKLKNVVVDMLAWKVPAVQLSEWRSDLPEDMLFDTMLALKTQFKPDFIRTFGKHA